jgi:hypothetical protein
MPLTSFDAARSAALMGDLVDHVRGRRGHLLPFDQVRDRLHLKTLVDRGIQDVPLDHIVGTLGRAREFNRAFLPKREALRERWTEVARVAESMEGFPPIETYKVGTVHFVVDGHHRVSVARRLGAPSIEARVREFLTPVVLSPEDDVDTVLSKAVRADFLDVTGLQPDPEGEFDLTQPAGYERLLEHIQVHGYFRGAAEDRDIPWQEEVASWHEQVFRPMVAIIRSSGIMASFSGRTEADLYLFTMNHLHRLREQYGSERVAPEAAVRHLRRIRPSWWQRAAAFLGLGRKPSEPGE